MLATLFLIFFFLRNEGFQTVMQYKPLSWCTTSGWLRFCTWFFFLLFSIHLYLNCCDGNLPLKTIASTTTFHSPNYSILTFKIFDFSDFIILDPSFLEDKVCDNKLSICFNNHRELCGVDIEGCACLSQELLMNCSNQAATIAVQLVDKIKSAIQKDIEHR